MWNRGGEGGPRLAAREGIYVVRTRQKITAELNRRLFFRQHPSVSSLVTSSEKLSKDGDPTFRAAVFLPASASDFPLSRLKLWLGTGITVDQELPEVVPVRTPDHQGIRAFFFRYPGTTAWVLLTTAERDEFRRAVVRFGNRLHPWYVEPTLRSRDFRRLLTVISDHRTITEARVTDYVARSLFSRDDRLHVRTRREWTDERFPRVFERLSEQKAWLRSIRVRFRSASAPETSVSLSRKSHLSATGDFRIFFGEILGSIVAESAVNMSLFENRGVENSPTKRSRPLAIEYELSPFADKREFERLRWVLDKFPQSSVAVIHANPYFHASLLDHRDGSSYEVWVLSQSRLVLMPKTRATAASLGQLADFICDNFIEGQVRNFELE